MISPPMSALQLPLPARGPMALKAAVERVIEEHVREGLSLYIWRDGRVVEVPPEELRAPSRQ
jgi:hypothetical protein